MKPSLANSSSVSRGVGRGEHLGGVVQVAQVGLGKLGGLPLLGRGDRRLLVLGEVKARLDDDLTRLAAVVGARLAVGLDDTGRLLGVAERPDAVAVLAGDRGGARTERGHVELRPAGRARVELGLLQPEPAAVHRHRLPVPQPRDRLQAAVEALEHLAGLGPVEPQRDLVEGLAGAHAEEHPPRVELFQRHPRLGDHAGVVVVDDRGDAGADRQARRAARGRRGTPTPGWRGPPATMARSGRSCRARRSRRLLRRSPARASATAGTPRSRRQTSTGACTGATRERSGSRAVGRGRADARPAGRARAAGSAASRSAAARPSRAPTTARRRRASSSSGSPPYARRVECPPGVAQPDPGVQDGRHAGGPRAQRRGRGPRRTGTRPGRTARAGAASRGAPTTAAAIAQAGARSPIARRSGPGATARARSRAEPGRGCTESWTEPSALSRRGTCKASRVRAAATRRSRPSSSSSTSGLRSATTSASTRPSPELLAAP